MFRSAHRLRVSRRTAAVALVVLALSPLAGLGSSSASARALDDVGSSTTVTQTNPALFAYEPTTHSLSTEAPSVTVDQTKDLTNQVVHVTWSNFTPSRTLSGNPGFVTGGTLYGVGVYECRGDTPTTSPYADQQASSSGTNVETDCYRWTTDQYLDATDGEANAVKTFTAADGTGEAYIQVETNQENSFLGCNATTPCSIVVVPMFGGPIANKYSAKKCAVHTKDAAGGSQAQAIDSYIGDACSWEDRLTVPLTFAPSVASCPSTSVEFTSGGSPLLGRAMAQWRPSWCQAASPVTFDYAGGLSEYVARSDFVTPGVGLSKTLDTALTTQPATSDQAAQRAFTYAPMANTSIAIALVVDDDVTGKQVTTLKLNARLVAKLLTQSYSLRYGNCPTPAVQSASCDPGVAGNPGTILLDPEFRALNPSWANYAQGTTSTMELGTFLPTVLSGNSDLIYELTRWIASNPAAAAFLAGAKDQWGMHVNTYYKNPGYPTSQLEEMDPGYTAPASESCAGNGTMQVAWGPITGLPAVAATLLANRSTAQDSSQYNPGPPCFFSKVAPETPGTRFLLAIMDEGQARAFQFPTAQLQNAAGAFVAPSPASVAAATSDLVTNADGITQHMSFTAKNPAAYPLTLPVYAMVPTCKLSATTAGAIDAMLSLTAGSQTPGTAPGDLNLGFVPLTAAQLAQNRKAQAEVAAQRICTTSAGAVPVSGSSYTAPSGPTTVQAEEAGTAPATAGTSAGTAAAAAATAANSPAAAGARPPTTTATAFGHRYGSDGSRPAVLLPALIVGAALLLIGSPSAYLLASGAGAPAWLRRFRLKRGPA